MRMKESNRSPGKGSTVTLSRKADGVKRNPEATTERGKRRAAIRRRRAAAAAALSMDNAEMVAELTGLSA